VLAQYGADKPSAMLLFAAAPYRNVALSGMTHDIHEDVKQDEGIMAMHADAERFDPRTEEVFKILQVGGCTAPALRGSTWPPPWLPSQHCHSLGRRLLCCVLLAFAVPMLSAQLEPSVDCNRAIWLADLFVIVSAILSSCSVRL
jgi:hypothetical protein